MASLRVASVALLMVGGCAIESNDDSTTSVEQHIPAGALWCEDWGCGMNSPEIDHLGMHDIHGVVGGLPNANGFRIINIEKVPCAGCVPVKYKTIFAEKAGLVVTGATGTLTGGAVSGVIVTVANPTNTYEIKIGKMGRTAMWAHIVGGEMTPTYEIAWDVVAGGGGGDQKRVWKNICKKAPVDGSPDLLGMDRFQSVVFENDLIDAEKKTVTLRPEKFWWNIGCAGHALAKLHLTGHTSAAAAMHGFHTDERMRQGTLKMITGDYCGTGFAFTVAGQKLGWTDQFSWNKYAVGFAGKKESEWTEKGASCLNDPRVLANATATGSATFPVLLDSIKDECGGKLPDVCKDTDPYTLNGAHMVAGNP
jgi:hypothetical protein